METRTFWDACSELNSALFKTYAVIHRLCDNNIGYCFAKNKIIAERIKKHEVSVSRDISELIEKGYLYSLEIKKGYITAERRIYTIDQYKLYLEDKRNLENLLVTTYKEVDGISLFTNERYIDNEKRKDFSINKNVNGNSTLNKNINGTVNKNVNGTLNKNVKQNYSNINLSNIKPTYQENKNEIDLKPQEEKTEVGGNENNFEKIKKMFEQHGIPADVKVRLMKLVKEKNISFERVVEVLKIAPLKQWKDGAIYKALENNWNLDIDAQTEEKKKADEKAEKNYQKSMTDIEKMISHKEKVKLQREENEKLLEYLKTLSFEEQERLKAEALKIAIKQYGSFTGKTMANTLVIFEILRKYKLEKTG